MTIQRVYNCFCLPQPDGGGGGGGGGLHPGVVVGGGGFHPGVVVGGGGFHPGVVGGGGGRVVGAGVLQPTRPTLLAWMVARTAMKTTLEILITILAIGDTSSIQEEKNELLVVVGLNS